MKKLEDSRALAKEMVSIGTMAGKKTVAVITDMDQPLGRAVGNSLEVREAIVPARRGTADFKEVVFALGSQMLMLAGRAADEKEAAPLMEGVVQDGSDSINLPSSCAHRAETLHRSMTPPFCRLRGRHWWSRQKRADMCTGFWRKTSELHA